MENYGFKLITKEEANGIGLPNGSGLFGDLFTKMTNDIKRKKNTTIDFGEASAMNSFEKKISFLNRYFVFKKIRKVNAESVALSMLENADEEIVISEKPVEKLVPKKVVSKVKVAKPIKLNKKIVLMSSPEQEPVVEPIVEEPVIVKPVILEPVVEEPIVEEPIVIEPTTKPKSRKSKSKPEETKEDKPKKERAPRKPKVKPEETKEENVEPPEKVAKKPKNITKKSKPIKFEIIDE
jgi:hypothetical protein